MHGCTRTLTLKHRSADLSRQLLLRARWNTDANIESKSQTMRILFPLETLKLLSVYSCNSKYRVQISSTCTFLCCRFTFSDSTWTAEEVVTEATLFGSRARSLGATLRTQHLDQVEVCLSLTFFSIQRKKYRIIQLQL